MAAENSEYESPLMALERKREVLKAELQHLESAIDSIRLAMGNKPLTRSVPPQVGLGDTDPFKGLTKPQIIHKTLQIHGEAMSAREILDFLEENDRAPVAMRRHNQVQATLRSRQKSPGDVLHVGGGKWGLRDWYSPSEIELLLANVEGSDLGRARDREEHISKTVEGIREAQKKGVRVGAPPRITPEQWEFAVDMSRKGMSLREIHRQIEARLTPESVKPPSYQAIHSYSADIKSAQPYPENWKAYYLTKERENDRNSDSLGEVE